MLVEDIYRAINLVEVIYKQASRDDDVQWWLCNSHLLVTVSAEGRVENQKLNQTASIH